jgi:hypothetical protein
MSYILKTKMTNEKYGTCLKTNDLNFGHIHGPNKNIMTRPKTRINQSQESICTNILLYIQD